MLPVRIGRYPIRPYQPLRNSLLGWRHVRGSSSSSWILDSPRSRLCRSAKAISPRRPARRAPTPWWCASSRRARARALRGRVDVVDESGQMIESRASSTTSGSSRRTTGAAGCCVARAHRAWRINATQAVSRAFRAALVSSSDHDAARRPIARRVAALMSRSRGSRGGRTASSPRSARGAGDDARPGLSLGTGRLHCVFRGVDVGRLQAVTYKFTSQAVTATPVQRRP